MLILVSKKKSLELEILAQYFGHNSINIRPISMNLIPIDSSYQEESIDVRFIWLFIVLKLLG